MGASPVKPTAKSGAANESTERMAAGGSRGSAAGVQEVGGSPSARQSKSPQVEANARDSGKHALKIDAQQNDQRVETAKAAAAAAEGNDAPMLRQQADDADRTRQSENTVEVPANCMWCCCVFRPQCCLCVCLITYVQPCADVQNHVFDVFGHHRCVLMVNCFRRPVRRRW